MKSLSQPFVCYQASIRLLIALCDANHTGSIELYLPYQKPPDTHNYCPWDQSNVDKTLLSANIPYTHTHTHTIGKTFTLKALSRLTYAERQRKGLCFTCKTAMKNYLDLVSSECQSSI